jgi:hypothetical protein
MGRTNAGADAPEQAADVERELKEMEERAEYCSRTARFYAAAHQTLAAEVARLRVALGGEARRSKSGLGCGDFGVHSRRMR